MRNQRIILCPKGPSGQGLYKGGVPEGFLEEESWKLRPDRRWKQEQPEVGRGEALYVEAAAVAKTGRESTCPVEKHRG